MKLFDLHKRPTSYFLDHFTYQYMCNAETYVEQLMALNHLKDDVLPNRKSIADILANPSCQVKHDVITHSTH